MPKYTVTFTDGSDEIIEADSYVDVKTWVDFMVDDPDSDSPIKVRKVRLAAKTIDRIDVS